MNFKDAVLHQLTVAYDSLLDASLSSSISDDHSKMILEIAEHVHQLKTDLVCDFRTAKLIPNMSLPL